MDKIIEKNKLAWVLNKWYEKVAFVIGVIFTSYLVIYTAAVFLGAFIEGFIKGFNSVG